MSMQGILVAKPQEEEELEKSVPNLITTDLVKPHVHHATATLIIHWGQLLAGVLAIAGWLTLFTLGIVVGSKPYRDVLGSPHLISTKDFLRNMAWTFTSYTITNIAMLACLTAFLGELAWRVRIEGRWPKDKTGEEETTARLNDGLTSSIAAIFRGFVLYLGALSGLLVLATDAIANAQQADYVRLASTISVLSFLAGYNYKWFHRVIERVSKVFEEMKG